MKLFEINPFDEPVLTRDEEIVYLRRQIRVLQDRSDRILQQANVFYTENGNIYRANHHERTHNPDVVFIPYIDVTRHADAYGVTPASHNEDELWNNLQEFRKQALKIRQQYQLASNRLKEILHIPGIR